MQYRCAKFTATRYLQFAGERNVRLSGGNIVQALEIIDTAVKIGLGALIAGITTYIVGERKFRQERAKEKTESAKKIMLEISLNFQKSNEATNEFINLVNLAINHGEDDLRVLEQKCKNALDKAFSCLGTAYSLANLIGLARIFDLLNKYTGVLSDLDETTNLLRDGIPDSGDYINEFRNKCKALEVQIYAEISKSYKEINA